MKKPLLLLPLLLLLVAGTILKEAMAAEEEVKAEVQEEKKETVTETPPSPPSSASLEEKEEEGGEAPVVRTSTGKVSGIREKATEGRSFFSYYSIPFAKAPIGSLRFKDPEMISGWGGVRDGSKPSPMCPQASLASVLSGGEYVVVGDEDCLYLNIFTPKPRDQRHLLPVMVFLHGGGYVVGSALDYPPHVMLNEDVVLVTLQYRLGVLGFLSTEDDEAPGNLGLKDQTLALHWLQRNVASFGGDPLRVTLFGESAGAASVHLQILSPKSIGLFKRAILHSGAATCPWTMGAKHVQMAEYTGSVFNCTAEAMEEAGTKEGAESWGSKELISCLQKVDALSLAHVADHIKEIYLFPMLLGPRVDGQFLPAHPDYLMREGRHKRVDLISGVNQHDGAFFTAMTYGNEMVRSSIMHNFAHKAPFTLEFRPEDVAPLNQTIMIFDRYLGGPNLDAEHADKFTELMTDRHFAVCHDLATQLHSAALAPHKNATYRYELQHRGQHSLNDIYNLDVGKHWVSHADDLNYFFEGVFMFKRLQTEEDLKVRKILLKLWTNFAATGNPTPDDSLGFTWDPVLAGDLKFLSLSPAPRMKEDNRKETRDFWYSLPTRQNIFLHPERVPNLVYSPRKEEENDQQQQHKHTTTTTETQEPETTKKENETHETSSTSNSAKETKPQRERQTKEDGGGRDEL